MCLSSESFIFLTNFTQKDWFWLYSDSCHIGMYIFLLKLMYLKVNDRGNLTIFLVYFYDGRVKCDSNAKKYLYGLSNKVLWMNIKSGLQCYML